MRTIKTLRARPRCFAKMYDLTETEMAERCVLGGCRSFGDCMRRSPSPIEVVPASVLMPAEPAADHEYGLVKW